MFSKTMFLLLAVIAGALAGPIAHQMRDDNSCARRCSESNKFRYAPGTTHEFTYDIQTHTAMEGASGERAALGIRATADIEVLSKCDMALRLRDVRVYRSDPTSTSMKYVDESGEFRRQLERYPLRFSFQDGIIEELCPQEGESTWALNIKRGLLTAVQNSMDSLDKDQKIKESDVTGECTTNYTVVSSGWYSNTRVKKTKDLLGCTDRDGYRSHVHAMPYQVTSEIQSLPLMKSTHECEQEIDKNGLLSSALIRETHTFRPFSQGTSGATTKIIQKLDYKTQRSGVATKPEYIQRRAGVAFEHAYGPGNEDQPRRDAENKLSEICSGIREDIRPETPRHFSELVYIVKNMDIEGLRTVYRQVKQGKVCGDRRIKKFFLDSLPMASTGPSIELMKDVLLSGEVTGAQATMWISSLSFIHYPTEEMLQQVQALLENSQYSQTSMLPISTMVNNYCSHRQSCSEEYVIERIISAIERVIGRGCYVRDSNLDATMVALRALGNAGHLDRISRILSTCVHRENNPTEVRVTATQAYRRIPCTSDRSSLMSVYQDSDEDSEVRIAAYLAVMQCPDEDILSRVQQNLENERANQVGSFVWSHLTNLIESSSPHKQSIRRILEDQTLKKEFDLETLKYSRNYEGSLFLEKFNTGAMAESNVIFSDKSFLPRSAMLNMTVDLFGNSVNLFEMGGRIEGLEYLIENYLGPYSYFGSAKKPEGTAKLDHLRGDIYMRMFGNELYYNHFMGTDPLASAKKFNLLDMLIKMSDNKDYSFTQSVMFIDSSMIVPTSCGLPLNLTVNGTATIDLQATGVVDLRKLTTSPKSLLIDGILKPSGAIQISGTMSMDAFVTKTGLRVVNTWHSSSALKGRVELQRGKVISADWEFPQNKMEILDVSTAFFSIHGDLEREQDLLADSAKSLELCTGSRLATVTGLEICNAFKWTNASMKEDAPYFPFTGPFSQTLTLYKRDTHTAYKFRAAVSATPYSTGARLEFNTPGSKVDREMAINFDLSSKQKQLEINLVSPWKKAEVKGSLDYKKDNVGMKGKLIVDGRSEYSVISGVAIKKVKNMVTYTPQIVVRRPGVKVIKLAGQISHDGLKKANVDLQLDGIRRDPITLTGALLNTRVERSAKAVLNIEPKQDYTAEIGLLYQNFGKSKAIIKIVPTLVVKTPSVELVTVSGSGDYREGKSLKAALTMDAYKLLSKPIIVKCDLKRTSGNREKYSGFVMVNSKLVVAKMSGNMQRKKSILSTTITLDYNFPKIRSIKKDRISFSSKFTDRSTKSLWNYQLNTNFEDKRYPLVNFVTNNEFSHNRKLTKVSTSVRYGPKEKTSNRHLTVYAMVNHILDPKTSKVDINLKTEIGPLDTKLNLKGKHINDGRSLDSSMAFGYGPGTTIETSLSLKNKGRKSLNLYGEASLVYPGKQLNLKTDLVQARKDYTHTITLQLDKATSSIVTTYTQPKESIHRITSSIEPHFMKPIQLQAETDLDLKDFKASAKANYDEAAYGASTTFKYTPNTNGKWALDVSYPARHVMVEVEGGKKGNNFQGIADAKWDADKDVSRRFLLKGKLNQKPGGSFSSAVSMKYPSRDIDFNIKHAAGRQYSTRADLSWEPRKKIQVDTSFLNVESKKGRSVDVSLRVRSPFEGYEDMFAKATSDNGAKRYATTTQMYWSDKKNQLSSTISIKKPYSLRNLDLSVTATSPFKGYRKMNVEASHNLESALKTIIKGNIEGKSAKITLNGENRSNGQKRDIEGSLTVKSTIKGMKGLTVQVSHKDDLKKFSTDALLNIEGDKYSYGFDMNHGISGWQMQNTGKLVLSSPRHRLVNNWQHRNSEKEVSSTLTSEWGRGRRIFINVFGNHDATLRTKTLGEINIETPWEPIRKMDFNMDNEFGTGLIKHSSSIKQSNDITGSVGINYIRTNGQATADFKVVSPFTNLNGKTEARYSDYPMAGHAEVGWAPYKKISVDGSLSAHTSNNFDSSLRLTSPFEYFRDIMVKASNKKEGSDVVSRASLNYNIRKSLEFESRMNTENLNRFTATIKTPFDNYKSVEAGVEYTGGQKNFDGKANFGIMPVLGNFAGILNWNLDSDMTGKMRLETPFNEFHYVQILARSEQTGKGRHSMIETEYYPRKTISLDTTYNLGLPLSFDATVKTPFINMEHISASVKHALRKSSLQSHVDVTLGSADNIGGDLRLKWANGLSGTLLVNTPIIGYETSKLSFRHEGSLQEFKCHGEAEFARETGEADLEFQHGYQTSASLSLKTPFQGYEETKVAFNKQGPLNNMRGEMSLDYGRNQKINVMGQHKFGNGRMDSTLIIKSPFSDDIRLAIDHNGQIRGFLTKISGNVGSRHTLNSESTLNYHYPLIDLSTNLRYTVNWKGRNIGLKVHKNGYLDDLSAKIIGTLDNDEIELTSFYKNNGKIEGSVNVKTPFQNYENVGISLKHSGNLQAFSTEGILRYMNDKAIEGKLTMTLPMLTAITATAELRTPFQGFEDTSLNYQHSIGYPRTTSSGTVTYAYNNKLTSELDLQMSPKLKLNFEIKTPFNGLETNRIVATHDGPIENCQSHLELEVLGTTMSGDSSFEHGIDTRGSISAISNIEGIESFRASLNKEGSLENFRGAVSATLKDSTIEAAINGRIADGVVQGSATMKTPFRNFRDTAISVDHTGNWNDFSSEGLIRYMDGQTLEGKVKISHNGFEVVRGNVQIKTPFRQYESMSIEHSHRIRPSSVKSNSVMSYGYGKEITSDISLETVRDITVNAVVKTPFQGYEQSKAIFSLTGSMANFNSHAEVEFHSTEASMDAAFAKQRSTQGNIVITTNIPGYENMKGTFSIEGDRTNLKSTALINLKESTVEADISLDLRRKVEGYVTIRTPFNNFKNTGASILHTGNLRQFTTEGSIRYMDGRVISGRVSANANGNSPSLSAELTTPFLGIEKQTIDYRQSVQENGGKGNLDIMYGNNQKIAVTVNALWKPKIEISAEIRTPSTQYKRSRIAFEHEGTFENCKTTFEMQALGKSINADSEMVTGPDVRGNLNIATNIEGFESMKMLVKKEGDVNNLKAMASLTLRDSTAEATLSHVFTNRRLSTKITLKNPYTEDIDMQLDFNGRPLAFKNKLSASMGPDAAISSDSTFRVRELTIDITSLMSYTLAGAGASGRMKFHKEGTLSDLKMRLDGEYNGQKSRAVVEFRAVDGVHGEVMLSTPFRGYRNLGMSVDHSGELNQFDTRAKIEYMDRREITAKLSHMNQGLERIESSIELSTPFIGYEVTKAQLQHSAITNEINCNAAVQYGRGHKLTSEIHASSSPKYDFEVKVTTPFSQYEELSASSSFEHGIDRYAFEGKLNAGEGNQFAVDSTVDLSSTPLTAVAHLSTPFEKFDSAEISLSHHGQLNNFHSTGRVETPLTGPVSGEATLNYQSPLEMNGMVALSNDKKFSIQNTQRNGKYISNILLAWSPREEITFDGSYMLQDAYTSKQLQTEMSVKTPFAIIRQAAVRFNHQDSADKYNENIEADYNGNTVLDMDVELVRGSRDQGSITMRQPRPMVITMAGAIVNKNLDGEMFVNWDRDEPQSNIRVQTSVTDRSGSTSLDKDLTVKLIHPSRTVGISGNIKHDGQQTKSHGELFWNEDAGDKIFYDVAMTDGSRRYNTKYDTTVKIGSPLRSIQMDGSYSNTGVSRSVDGAFYWDADRDNSKQVGLKATLTPGANNKADISLRLPSISKDIKLDTEMVINDGKTLFNGQTKLSYSTDSRKTLTMTSRLEDISYGYGNNNYSFVVGVSHPYTDVDVQMTSHIGSSSEKYSTGMNLMYLTARRERKNIALRGEINNLRNQIELQMMTPVKNIQLSAEVEENPYKLKIRNTYDGKVVRSDLTVDSRRKVIDFQTNYDIDDLSKMIHMNAGYVNSSAVQAVLFHEINSRQISDSLLAVRLNTSRLLHTRISWRPQMISDIQNFLASEVKQYGGEVKNAFHSTYEAVGKELSGKYYRVAQAVTEEVTPFVKLLETEMAAIERNLDSIRRDVRRMYRRNDFFLADMGEYFNVAFDAYKQFVYSTKETFANLNHKIAQLLEEIKHYPVGQKYQTAVADALGSVKQAVDNVVAETVEVIASMDEELQGIRDSYNHHYNRIQNTVSDSVNNIRNHPKLTELRLRFSNTYQDYLNTMTNSLQQLDLNSVMDSARNTLTSQLSHIMRPDDLQRATSLTNNVYQEGVWAYNYWQVEENLKSHLRSIIEILKDLVEDELKQYRDELVFLQKSRITVWDPEQGEIQIELYLPIPLESLDTLPNVQPYVQQAKTAINKYIPNRSTITRYYNNYMPTYLMQSQNETNPRVVTDRIIPARRPRGQLRRYNAVPI